MKLNDFISLFKGTQTHYKLRTLAAKIFSLNLYCFTRVLSLLELSRQAKINIFLKKLLIIACKDKQTKTQHIHIKTHPSNTRICKIMSNDWVFWYLGFCVDKAVMIAEDILKRDDVTI